MKNIKNFEARVDVPKLIRWKYDELGTNVTKSKKTKLYEYYLCDYCGEQIKIEKDYRKRTGGTVEIPINSFKKLKLALCTKCLKPVLEMVRKEYDIEI